MVASINRSPLLFAKFVIPIRQAHAFVSSSKTQMTQRLLRLSTCWVSYYVLIINAYHDPAMLTTNPDTKTYTEEPLLYDGLRQFQGPALLARNNKIFTDKDFASLASIGDSRKRHDLAATGKFGQGFNSVRPTASSVPWSGFVQFWPLMRRRYLLR